MRAHKLVRGPLWATLVAALVAAGVSLMVFAQSGEAIVGGTAVSSDDKYPFMVALLDKAKGGPSNKKYFCAGSLITPHRVLTAAHCVDDKMGKESARIRVVEGRATLKSKYVGDGYVAPVPENGVVLHPKYRRTGAGSTMPYDVAVLKLQPIVASALYEKGKPISLADSSQNSLEKPGNYLTVAGWGRTARAPGIPNRMNALRVPIVPDNDADNYTFYDPTIMLATGLVAGKGPCSGDSGAPLFDAQQVVQIGVVHGGHGCGNKGFATVYAEVNAPEIRDFIYQASH